MEKSTTDGSKVVLHVGMQKTGTTFLQERIFQNHPDIQNLASGSLPGPLWAELQDLVRKTEGWCAGEIARKLALQMESRFPVYMISWEDLATKKHTSLEEKASRLRKEIPNPHAVVITIRHPYEMARSLYTQSLRRLLVAGATQKFLSFNDWLIRNAGRKNSPFAYQDDAVRAYVEAFGRERVHVFTYERLQENQTAFLSEFSSVIGCDSERANTVAGQDRVHSGLNQGTVELIQALRCGEPDGSVVDRYVALASTADPSSQVEVDEARKSGADIVPIVYRALEQQLAATAKFREEISKEHKSTIQGLTGPGLRWLDNEFRLNLALYDYPLWI